MSILATVCAKTKDPTKTISMFPEVINVITNDDKLTKAINKEFPSGAVKAQEVAKWLKTI
jgi:hypothetical protein